MPSSTVLTSTDPYEFQTLNRDVQHKVVITARGAYQAQATRIELHRLLIRRGWQSLPTIWHAATPKERSAVVFPTSQTPGIWVGIEVQPGDIFFRPQGGEHYVHSCEYMRYGSLSLTADDLATFGRALVGRDLNEPPGSRVMRPQPAAMSRLLRLHEATGHLAETAPEVLAAPAVAKAMEQELVCAMVTCLTDTAAAKSCRPYQQTVMRRFEQMLEANQDEPLYIPEICAAIGVPGRTLRHLCQEHLGVSPHRYLWLRRMNQARRALILADPHAKTVTEIATNHGFWEFGRFAVRYQHLFGEAPSVTLRRPPDDRGSNGAALGLVSQEPA
jgi:AraC-like DNA-binding protein